MKKIAAIIIIIILVSSSAFAGTIYITDTTMSDASGLITKLDNDWNLYYPKTSEEAFTKDMNYYAVLARAYLDIKDEVPEWTFVFKTDDTKRNVAYIGYSYSRLKNTNDVFMAFYFGKGMYYVAGYNYTSRKLYLFTDGPYPEETIIEFFDSVCQKYYTYKSSEIRGEVEVAKLEHKSEKKKK